MLLNRLERGITMKIIIPPKDILYILAPIMILREKESQFPFHKELSSYKKI